MAEFNQRSKLVMRNLTKLVLSAAIVTSISACGSSDGETDESTKIQLYNAMSNSPSISLQLDEISLLTNIDYGDASTSYYIDSSEYSATITAADSNNEQQTIIEQDLTISGGQHNLLFVSGEIGNPQISQYVYGEPELEEDEINLVFANFATDAAQYQIYLGNYGEDVATATHVGNLEQAAFSDQMILAQENYIVYLKNQQDEVVYESQVIELQWQNTYILALRDNFGPGTPALAIDLITDSTYVYDFSDISASAAFRVVNATNTDDKISYQIQGSGEQYIEQQLSPGQVSEFNEVELGDFVLSVSDSTDQVLAKNMLFSLSQNEVKSVVLYSGEQNELLSTTIENDLRPKLYSHDITILNASFDYSDIQLYFVESDKTIETTPYHLYSIDPEETGTISLPDGEYQIKVVYQDDENNQSLLYQSPLTQLTASNYLMIFNKSDDGDYGYTVQLIE